MKNKTTASLKVSRFWLATIGVATVIVFAGFANPRQALAQNLVQDPNFFDGLTDYQTVGQVNADYVPFGPTPPGGMTEGSTNTAVLFGPGASETDSVATVSQAIATVPNTTYLVTFSVNFDPGTTDSL